MQKTNFILLAAGSSTRMGRDKAQLLFNGHPWIFEQAQNLKNSGHIGRLVVVSQPLQAENYRKILEPLHSDSFQVQIVINPDPMSKPSDSIRCGLKAFDSSAGAFVSPIDIPQSSLVVQTLLKNNSAKIVRPLSEARPGHPVWIAGEFLKAFNETEQRLDDFLRSHLSDESNVAVTSADILLNLNTPEAWESYVSNAKA